MAYGFKKEYREFCLSGPRRAAPEKLKTVIRLPVAADGKGE